MVSIPEIIKTLNDIKTEINLDNYEIAKEKIDELKRKIEKEIVITQF